jgi:hypothetical protein
MVMESEDYTDNEVAILKKINEWLYSFIFFFRRIYWDQLTDHINWKNDIIHSLPTKFVDNPNNKKYVFLN